MRTSNDSFQKWIARKRNRIKRRNKNWLCIMGGDTGSGKSYTAARICELIDPTFLPAIIKNGIKSRVALGETHELLNILDAGKLKRGNMVIFDEAGIAISSRDWFKEINKMIMYILQTFRHMNIGVIFTVPDVSFVDKQARSLFHTFIHCLKIDYKKEKVICKPFELQNNPYQADVYRKYPRYKGWKNTRFFIKKPAKAFIDQYEPLKVELSKKLRARAITIQDRVEIKEKTRRTDKEIMKEIKERNVERDAYTLQFEFGIGKDRAYRIINNWEKFSPLI